MSPGSNIARKLRVPDLMMNMCPVPLGTKHVDTNASSPFGVLEDQHVDRVQNFEYFCPETSLLKPLDLLAFVQILQYTELSSLLYKELPLLSVVSNVCHFLLKKKNRMTHPHGKLKNVRPTPYQGLKN